MNTLTTIIPPEAKANFDELVRAAGLSDIAAEAGSPPMSHTDAVLVKLLSVSPAMDEIKDRVRKLALANNPVLILGETGTGKEYIAQALHGPRKPNTFVALNCGAIPSELLESELFGAKKGAYTGANTDKLGLLELARDGTLFLDEIGDMPLYMQCKLLRVLQEKKFRKVGETAEQQINFRVVSATNHMELETSPAKFRLDLYYRLAGSVIKLPRLKERGINDISLICSRVARTPGIAELAILEAERRPLNGNVRELLNILEEMNAIH